ncbi:unnamed protein product [Eruca vesicaria subsp. sativa]|uniref:RING-type domain-containing protein n=1 Tax=Eruca vesicaria subsp. sativa TaxID=29727 RepID=A0ABC8IXW2_ERUVS|nr:unnamed protein product [Eruca vesicaria subsp. sativa]
MEHQTLHLYPIYMEPYQEYALTFGFEAYQALEPKRNLTINITRINTNQTNISINLKFSTNDSHYLTDFTIGVMESMLIYHDMSIHSAERIAESASTFAHTELEHLTNYEERSVHIILYLTEYNPHSIHRIDIDIATTNLHSDKRIPSLMEENEICKICMGKIVSDDSINELQYYHIYHHQCIVDWIRMNIRCPTCRATIS